jgi:hypothetical protein
MEPQRRVQVVLGEAERDDGLLRFVLEAEGFDLIGLASSDEELERVLRGARPSVVVLDGGISAAAALRARESLEDAALVVVWPDGISAVLAEERVEPSFVIEDLGDAVRRAVDRVRPPGEPVVVLNADDDTTIVVAQTQHDPSPRLTTVPSPTQASGPRRTGRRMQVLVAAATWFLVITTLTAIATAVPHVMDAFRGGRSKHASAVTSPEPSGRSGGGVADATSEQQQDRCEDTVNGNGTQSGNGNGTPVRAHGCPPRGRSGENAGTVDGRPDDPGSQGNGGASDGHGSNGGSGSAATDDESSDDPLSHGRSDEEHDRSQAGMSEGAEEGHGRASDNGRGGHG